MCVCVCVCVRGGWVGGGEGGGAKLGRNAPSPLFNLTYANFMYASRLQ